MPTTPPDAAGAASRWTNWQPALHRVRYYALNPHGRDFVVGDLHGCLEPFHRLLQAVAFRPNRDRVFCVGDLIDRGPLSLACLRLLKQPWFFSCRGNHEELLIEHLLQVRNHPPYDAVWLDKEAPRFSDRQRLAEEWVGLLQALPEMIVVGAGTPERFQVVHAEILEDGRPVTDALIDTWMFRDGRKAAYRALWGRALLGAYQRGERVKRAHDPERMSPTYCGHTIVPQVLKLAQQVFLDRGAFVGLDPARPHLDAGELGFELPDPGLVLTEPTTQRFWFAPTGGRGGVEAIECLIPETR